MEAVKEYHTPNNPPREWTMDEQKEAAEYLASHKTMNELRNRVAQYATQRATTHKCLDHRSNSLANLYIMECVDLMAIDIISSR